MANYTLTVYEKTGEKVLEELIIAANDREAKDKGQNRLNAGNFQDHTSRLTSPKGQLILFHR